MPEPTARAAAVDALETVERSGVYLSHLDDADDLDARAERQATEYVAGVTRRRRHLDFVLTRFYRGVFADMEPRLRQILRVGLYDVLYLDTPPHAAVHEAVELAKRTVRPGAGGLVNGILRAVLRTRDDLPEPATGDAARDLAVRHSHPTWMVRRWLARYGEEDTARLLAWNNARPAFGLRVNTHRTSVADFTARLDALDDAPAHEPSPYLDDVVRVDRLQPVLRAGMLADGSCAVQDEAAALVVRLLDPQPGETILDGCAAPGGKSLYAAIRMGDEGRVLAYDLHPSRVDLVRTSAEAHGLTIVHAAEADLRALPAEPDAPTADRVLVDAPCTGLGVLARRADLRWNRRPEAIGELAALQDELLDAAARLVRPGGLLVYATCTLAPEENEDRVAAFLTRHPDFAPESAHGFVPDALVTPEGHYAALPHRDGIDGAFAARLRRAA